MRRLLPYLIEIVLAAVVVLVASLLFSSYILSLMCLAGINVILVIALNITNGFTGLFALSLCGTMTLGAYISALLTLPPSFKVANLPGLPAFLQNVELPFLPAMIVGVVIATALTTLFVLPSIRLLAGGYFALTTLAFAEIVRFVAIASKGVTLGAMGLTAVPQFTNVWVVLAFVVVTIFTVASLLSSKYGRAWRAIRDDPILATVNGVNLTRFKTISFIVSCVFAAIGGILWAHLASLISPPSFDLSFLFGIIIIMIIGGAGSLFGAVSGALVLTLIRELLKPLESGFDIAGLRVPQLYGLSQILLAIVLLLILKFRPKGLLTQLPVSRLHQWARGLIRSGQGSIRG